MAEISGDYDFEPNKKLQKNKCSVCKEKFATVVSCLNHVCRSHEMRLACPLCTDLIANANSLKDHLTWLHGWLEDVDWQSIETKGSIPCDLCFESFWSEKRLKNHRAKAHGLLLTCEFCPEAFLSTHLLSRHLNRHHNVPESDHLIVEKSENEGIICELCETPVKNGTHLISHKYLEHNIPIMCEKCPHIRFYSAAKFEYHVNKKHGNTCVYCKVTFRSFEEKKIHQKFLKVCRPCKMEFKSSSELNMHIEYECPSSFTCDICTKKMQSKKNIQLHICQEHFNNYSLFQCETCKKSFLTEKSLDRHLEHPHTLRKKEDKAITCHLCGKILWSRIYFDSHLLEAHPGTIEGLTIYRCRYCKSRFRKEERLIQHTENAHVVCEICGKRFRRYDLKHHMNKHTGQRPFRCTLCGLAFWTPAVLYNHGRVHGLLPPLKPKNRKTVKKRSKKNSSERTC